MYTKSVCKSLHLVSPLVFQAFPSRTSFGCRCTSSLLPSSHSPSKQFLVASKPLSEITEKKNVWSEISLYVTDLAFAHWFTKLAQKALTNQVACFDFLIKFALHAFQKNKKSHF